VAFWEIILRYRAIVVIFILALGPVLMAISMFPAITIENIEGTFVVDGYSYRGIPVYVKEHTRTEIRGSLVVVEGHDIKFYAMAYYHLDPWKESNGTFIAGWDITDKVSQYSFKLAVSQSGYLVLDNTYSPVTKSVSLKATVTATSRPYAVLFPIGFWTFLAGLVISVVLFTWTGTATLPKQ
jgi:hypothetical protein